jgi:CDP-diacylglycerol--serine O-phosphatidyltransferase
LRKKKNKLPGVYLLPNLVTSGALFCGFYSIITAISGNYVLAAIYILFAMILDGLDGRVARMTNTQTSFGEYFDSLSDMLCFGVAPALLIYLSSLSMFTYGYLAKISYIACFIYSASTAIRLARFNSRNQTTDKKYFMGLASPAAAAILICYVWLMQDLGVDISSYITLTVILIVSLSILMISNIAYMSFKDINFKQKIPYVMLFAISLIISFISFDPPKVLFIFFLFYGFSGPGLFFIRRFKRSKLNTGAISPKDNQ